METTRTWERTTFMHVIKDGIFKDAVFFEVLEGKRPERFYFMHKGKKVNAPSKAWVLKKMKRLYS